MRANSLFSMLELVKPWLAESLVDAGGYASLARVAERLPRELSTFWGFECRLGEPRAAMDILFQTKRASRGGSLLAGKLASPLDALCGQWPAWDNLRRFAALWDDPQHAFFMLIRNIWLEFDTASAGQVSDMTDILGQPCIFFGPNSKELSKEQDARLICDVLRALDHPMIGEDTLKALSAGLPEGSRVFQVGIMLSRPDPGLRICAYPFTAGEVPVWLSTLGWQGQPDMLTGLLRQLPPCLESLAVDINLTPDGPAEKIGVECYMNWLKNDPRQWIPLLDTLAAMDLCLASKYRGILDFQGSMPLSGDYRNNADGVLYPFLHRRIHHIKLTLQLARITEAKAYLAVSHPGLDRNAIFSKNAGGAWLVQ